MKAMAHLVQVVFAVAVMMVIAACGVDVDSGQLPDAMKSSAHGSKSSSTAMPPNLRSATIASVQRDAPVAYAAHTMDGLVRLKNSAQGFVATVERQGLTVRSDENDSYLALRTVTIGCEGAIIPVTDVAPDAAGNRVEMHREGLTEWYLNGPLGVEQGFVIHNAPLCTGPKRIVMAIESDLTATLEDADGDSHGDSITFVDTKGHKALSYTDLFVVDATGKTIPAWLSLNAGELAIVVDDAGAAYPLTIDPLIWGQQAKLVASDGAAEDLFGISVSLWGDTALVGASHDTISGNAHQGSAYVFVRSGSTWIEQAKLVASDGTSADRFGFSVSISDDTALVGAINDAINGNADQGSAYVFVRNGSTWTEQAKLVAGDGATADSLGYSVSISGDTALVGAYGLAAESGPGSAYVFVRTGSMWTEQAKLVASDGVKDDEFGYTVSLSGDTALVGARMSDIGANIEQGSAYVFVRNGSSWTEQAKLIASDGAANDQLGCSVSVSGDTALVGANGGGSFSNGSAYVFIRNGTMWAEQAKLAPSDAGYDDGFGWSVSIAGDIALVGARFAAVGMSKYQGSAYVFARSGSIWTGQAKLGGIDASMSDSFGISVAISSGTALVGAFCHEIGANYAQGAAYVFVLRRANGDVCAAGDICGSGFCVDGVCCDSACGNGDPTDCQACSIAAGAMVDGECAPLAMGTECRTSSGPCDTAETCDGTMQCPADTNAPDGTACPEGTCTNGVCMNTGAGGAGGASSSSSSGSSSSGGGQIDGETNRGCACQTNSTRAPLSSSIVLLGIALLVFRRRS